MKHHTKTKGDVGLVLILADLTKNGFHVCLPLSEHLPFDLVAVSDTGRMSRVQVKYISPNRNGSLSLALRSVYSNSKGCHTKAHDLSLFDAYAIYSPEDQNMYYIPTSILGDRTAFNLRLKPSKQKNQYGYHAANDFRDPSVLFK